MRGVRVGTRKHRRPLKRVAVRPRLRARGCGPRPRHRAGAARGPQARHGGAHRRRGGERELGQDVTQRRRRGRGRGRREHAADRVDRLARVRRGRGVGRSEREVLHARGGGVALGRVARASACASCSAATRMSSVGSTSDAGTGQNGHVAWTARLYAC